MDLCFSRFCMARMRKWLAGEYGSLEALNRQWGTGFERWDVIPDTTGEVQRRGNYSCWADHRSFNPRLRLSGGSGYGAHGRQVLYNFYRNLFHGHWAGSYIFWQYSILNPDYRFCQSAKDIQDGYREIVDGGLAKLVQGAVRDNHGIAIHYSYPSIHGAWIVDGQTYPPVGHGTNDLGTNWGPTGLKFKNSRDGWTALLQDLGLQYDYVAPQQIESWELAGGNFRVLVLPFSVALSDKEVAGIRRFVEAGGAVVADGQAAVMDGHARWLPTGALDEVFGIRRSSPARQRELASTRPEVAIQLAAGVSALEKLDGAPAVIRNQHSKGAALYLNFFLDGYLEDSREGRAGRWKRLVGRALAEAGGVRPVPGHERRRSPAGQLRACFLPNRPGPLPRPDQGGRGRSEHRAGQHCSPAAL